MLGQVVGEVSKVVTEATGEGGERVTGVAVRVEGEGERLLVRPRPPYRCCTASPGHSGGI